MRILLVTFLILFWSGVAPAAERLAVTEALCVDGPVITLGQMLRADGDQAQAFLDRYRSEALLASPKFDGARATLNGPKLRELILQHLGPEAPLVTVPDQVQIQRGGQVVESSALYETIDNILTATLAPLGGEVEVTDRRLPRYLFLESRDQLHFKVEVVGRPAPGRVSLRLAAMNQDGRVLQSFTGTVFANVWKTVPCAARVLNRGDRLEATLVAFDRKNLAFLPRLPWDGRGLPLRMTMTVGTGQVISADAVEPIPVVGRGKIVTLVFTGASIRLTVPAECVDEGGIGSSIRVRNMQSRRIVTAQVRDAETVSVP